MSAWLDVMDRVLAMGNRLFGKTTSYQRPGFAPFAITGVPEFIDRLESPNRGQFYSVFYRAADFVNAPFRASVRARFTQPPNVGGTLTFDGIAYTSVLTLDNSTPYQFLRGSSPLGAASNLAACINADPVVAGTFFSNSTPAHRTCTATWVDNGDGSGSTIVSLIAPGIPDNAVLASDQMSYVSLDSKMFIGGGPLENDLITLDGTLFRVSDVPEHDPEGGIQLRLERKAL